MGWRDFFTVGFDRISDWTERINDPAQLRRKLVHDLIWLLIVAPAGFLFLAYYKPWGFSFPPSFLPVVVTMCLASLGNHYHAYRLRKKELAGEQLTVDDKLSRLMWRFAPAVGFFLSVFLVLIADSLWLILTSDSVNPGRVIRVTFTLVIVLFIAFSPFLYALCCDYTRAKRRLEATDAAENGSQRISGDTIHNSRIRRGVMAFLPHGQISTFSGCGSPTPRDSASKSSAANLSFDRVFRHRARSALAARLPTGRPPGDGRLITWLESAWSEALRGQNLAQNHGRTPPKTSMVFPEFLGLFSDGTGFPKKFQQATQP